MVLAPVEELCAALAQAFEAERELGYEINYRDQPPDSFQRLDSRVRGALQQAFKTGDLAAFQAGGYINFSSDHYTRNLVAASDDYELMVLCWRKGQGSRVHNHAAAHGWVTVLGGRVEETRYSNPRAGMEDDSVPTSPREGPAVPPPLPGVLGAVTPCPQLRETGRGVAGPGSILYINDGQALHAVRCADDTDLEEGAVTLHLYAPPVRRVFLYEPDQDRVVQRVPGFFSRGGVRVAEP